MASKKAEAKKISGDSSVDKVLRQLVKDVVSNRRKIKSLKYDRKTTATGKVETISFKMTLGETSDAAKSEYFDVLKNLGKSTKPSEVEDALFARILDEAMQSGEGSLRSVKHTLRNATKG